MPFFRERALRTVYRVCWGTDPLAFLPWDILTDPNRRPSRWDPPDFSYRVLYTADSLTSAFCEVLCDFSPRLEAQHILDAVTVDEPSDRSVIDIEQAYTEYLLPRYAASIIVPQQPDLVRIDEHSSMQMIAEALEVSRLKIGDLIGSHLELPRRASQAVYSDNEFGIICASAEVKDAVNYAFFERPTEKWSTDLVTHTRSPALNEQIHLHGALEILGLEHKT